MFLVLLFLFYGAVPACCVRSTMALCEPVCADLLVLSLRACCPPPAPSSCSGAVRYTHDVLFHSALGVVSHSLEGKDGKPCATYEAMGSASAAMHKLAMEPLLQ